jgi:hypothetical protein
MLACDFYRHINQNAYKPQCKAVNRFVEQKQNRLKFGNFTEVNRCRSNRCEKNGDDYNDAVLILAEIISELKTGATIKKADTLVSTSIKPSNFEIISSIFYRAIFCI